MNAAGLVIAIAGVWIVSQVFGGNALERLGILKPSASSKEGGIIPPGAGSNIPPNLPGGSNNPPYVDFGDFFGGGNQGWGRWL